MTQKEIILEQLAACHDHKGWFVAMTDALAGLDAARAAKGPEASSPSIWQIVYHITYWNERTLRRITGAALDPVVTKNEDSFGPAGSGDEAAWKALQGRFAAVMNDLAAAVRSAPEEKLQGPVTPGGKEVWLETLAHLTLHAAHHIGQIVTLRKLQGSWDARNGVS